jgi:acetyl esterase/lipase
MRKADLPLEDNVKITPQTPPMFLSVSDDDIVGSMGSVMVYGKMVENGVPCELHVFVKGGHGYGIRPGRGPAAEWNILCEKWLRQIGLLEK